MAIIEHKKQFDLSEAELFFCAGPQAGAGACPQGGWWPSDAMPYLRDTGVSQEDCFPYGDQQIPTDLAYLSRARGHALASEVR